MAEVVEHGTRPIRVILSAQATARASIMHRKTARHLPRVAMLLLAHLAASAPLALAVEPGFVNGFEALALIEAVHLDPQLQGQNVRLGPVVVTAVRPSANNSTFFVQVPPALSNSPAYPRYFGLKAFNASVIPGLLPGDCVSFNGTVIEFQGATELSGITNLVVEPGSACGAIAISPQLVAVGDVATDADTTNAGAQPGPLAEAFEGVLIRVGPVTAVASSSAGTFPVADGSSTSQLVIGSLLFQYNATVNDSFSSITGVLDQQQQNPGELVFRLLPRALVDVVP